MTRSKKQVVNEVAQNVQNKEVIMTNETTERKFDNFAYVKGAILKEYVKNMIAGKSLEELTFNIRNYYQNSFVINYLNKAGALKVANVELVESTNAEGKNIKTYNITVKDVNINATATSKAGKEFRLFDERSIGRAVMKANA